MAYSPIEDKFLSALTAVQFPSEPVAGLQQPQDMAQLDEGVQVAEVGATKMPDYGYSGQRQATMTDYDPTVRERMADFLQAGFEKFGMDRYKARQQAQTLIGGPSSNLPLNTGLADIVPFLGTALQTQEAARMGEESITSVQQGNYGTAALQAGGAVLGMVPGAAGTVKAGMTLAKNLPTDLPVGLSIKPVGDAADALLMPVKIGEREIKIPADQAAILQKALKNLTPAEQAKFRSDTAQRFVSIIQELPSTKEFAAAAIGGKAKKGWYEGSTQAILQVFGPDAPRFAALLSATSPQTSVESNLFNALQIWKNWTAAGRPTDRDSIVKVMGQSVQGNKGEESVLDAWINNSVSALSADDPSKVVLSGPKVNSFMLNLQGNVNEVTNDAWMAAFSLVDQKLFAGSLTKGGDPGKGPGYLAMNARVRETAAYLTKVTGETWTPAEVQETIWSWAKTLYEKAGSAEESRSAVQLIKDNAITDELIASTPDFRTLFYDQRFQPILEQSGYADQLARLREATGGADVAAGGQKPGAGGKAGALDPEAQRKLNQRNARRLDTLRKQREQAAAEKAQGQNPTGGVE